jgi:hypothetical protein
MVRFFRESSKQILMSIQDRDKQKVALDKTVQKFTELLPSVRPEPLPIEKALVIINGTAKSRAAVLLAEELNRNFGTEIDVICFYTEQKPETLNITKESYEDSLAFAYEHLKSEDFEIKGQVVENIEILTTILGNVLTAGKYDLIIVPSSFIGMKETRITQEEEEEEEAAITVMGGIFEYLHETVKNIPIMLIESEKINLELLWKNTCIFASRSSLLSRLVEKAIRYSMKKAEIHCLINVAPSAHEDKSEEEFAEYIERNKEEISRFEKANEVVFQEASRFVDFHFISTDSLEKVKKELLSFGKDVGIQIIYLPSKHGSLYGFFIDLLEDPEITFPILIAKEKVTGRKEVEEEEEEEEEEKKIEEAEELAEEIEEEVVLLEEPEEKKIMIDNNMKESIKEEVKKELLGEPKEEITEDEIVERIEEIVEEVVEEEMKEEEEDMTELDELKEEVKEEVKEEIKKEVKKEIKADPKREVKKEVTKELKKEESIEELKETIIEEIKEEIIEEVKYELKKDLKEPKKELKEKVIEEIKEEVPDEEKEEVPEEEEEEEEVSSRMEFE